MGLHEHECRGSDCGYCNPDAPDPLVHRRRIQIYPPSWVAVILVIVGIVWCRVF